MKKLKMILLKISSFLKTKYDILLRKFDKDKIIEAKNYFTELKDMIENNDINKLSKLIIDKL